MVSRRTRVPVALVAFLVVGLGTLPPRGPAHVPDAPAAVATPPRPASPAWGLPASLAAESGPDEDEGSRPVPFAPPSAADAGAVPAGARLSAFAIDGAAPHRHGFPGSPTRAPPVLSD